MNFNELVIADFRAGKDRLADTFDRSAILLLTTIGAKSGRSLTSPLVFDVTDGAVRVVATAAGATKHPAWYHNLVANPLVTVEIADRTVTATARCADEPDRSALFAASVELHPVFADYAAKAAGRVIPVVVLDGVEP